MIDDGQFGAALVLNGFNYDKAENVGTELKAVYTNGNLRAYANWAWAFQRATNRVSNEYLFDPVGNAFTASNWIFTDHTQIWTGSAGISYLWNGTRLSADMIYGSGLRAGFQNTDHNSSYAQVNTGLAHEFFIPGWNPVTLRFDVINVFDVTYAIRNGTGVGVFAPQYGPRRGYYFGLSQKFGPGANKPSPAPPTYLPVFLAPGYAPARISKGPVQTVWSWTGFYLGANAGRSTGKFNSDLLFSDNFGNPLFAGNSATKHYGGAGGGQIGYNWQAGMAVAGLESDVVFGHQRTATAPTCPGAICNPAIAMAGFDAPMPLVHQHNLDWFGTLRGRLGVAFTPSTFLYGTGGFAVGEVEHVGTIYANALGVDANGNPIPVAAGNNFNSRSLRAGWTAGVGLWSWTGFYFGANAGYATGDFDNSTVFNDPAAGTPMLGTQSSGRLKGGIGGVQTGYTLQSGIWLAGLETDIQFSSQRNITNSNCPATTCPAGIGYNPPVTLDETHNLDWFGTVRGRLGIAVTPDILAYGTGGLTVGGIAHSVAFSLGGITIGIDSNGTPTGRRHRGSPWGKLDRQGRIPPHGVRLGDDEHQQSAEHDAHGPVQLPHHRSDCPRRPELQI